MWAHELEKGTSSFANAIISANWCDLIKLNLGKVISNPNSKVRIGLHDLLEQKQLLQIQSTPSAEIKKLPAPNEKPLHSTKELPSPIEDLQVLYTALWKRRPQKQSRLNKPLLPKSLAEGDQPDLDSLLHCERSAEASRADNGNSFSTNLSRTNYRLWKRLVEMSRADNGNSFRANLSWINSRHGKRLVEAIRIHSGVLFSVNQTKKKM